MRKQKIAKLVAIRQSSIILDEKNYSKIEKEENTSSPAIHFQAKKKEKYRILLYVR